MSNVRRIHDRRPTVVGSVDSNTGCLTFELPRYAVSPTGPTVLVLSTVWCQHILQENRGTTDVANHRHSTRHSRNSACRCGRQPCTSSERSMVRCGLDNVHVESISRRPYLRRCQHRQRGKFAGKRSSRCELGTHSQQPQSQFIEWIASNHGDEFRSDGHHHHFGTAKRHRSADSTTQEALVTGAASGGCYLRTLRGAFILLQF